jgi:glycogen synthase
VPSDNLAFVTYETRFAPSGGIAAVMRYLPQQTKLLAARRTIVITPWHTNAMETPPATETIGNVIVQSENQPVGCSIKLHKTPDGFEWFFLLPDEAGHQIFHGAPDPYRTEFLVRDSLFFGAAVVRALPLIATGNWTLFLQDWEAATVALAAASINANVRCILTLHNSYDSGSISADTLQAAGINAGLCPGFHGLDMSSILERALLLVDRRIFTVSAQFASDLCEDVLQTRVMAPHLSHELRERIIGVDNGPFENTLGQKINIARRARNEKDLPSLLSKAEAISASKAGNYDAFICWKKARQHALIEVIKSFEFSKTDFPHPDATQHERRQHKPFWGNLQRFVERSTSAVPWFITGGRDDSRQRGHDVAVAAADKFLEIGGDGLFIFMPAPGDEEVEGLRFLRDVAVKSDGRVVALPFRFAEGFLAALEGAAFGIFPSFYEPFGGANEFYLQGTVGIARATGGLIEQIVPLRAARCYSQAVHRRASVWHSLSAKPTGILYRETDDEGTVESWAGINHGNYDRLGIEGPNRIDQRQDFPVFAGMIRELCCAMTDAARLFEDPALYTEMALEGMAYIERTFSWYRAGEEYQRVG